MNLDIADLAILIAVESCESRDTLYICEVAAKLLNDRQQPMPLAAKLTRMRDCGYVSVSGLGREEQETVVPTRFVVTNLGHDEAKKTFALLGKLQLLAFMTPKEVLDQVDA